MKDAKEIRKMLSIELEIPESRIDWINVRKVEDGVFCVRTGLFKDGSISWNGEERMLGFKKHEGDLYEWFSNLTFIGILNDCDKAIANDEWLF